MRFVQSPTNSKVSHFAGTRSRRPVPPAPGRPEVGFVYDFPLLFEQVLLMKGVGSPSHAVSPSLSRHQKSSVTTMDRRSSRARKLGRMRPCLVLESDDLGNPNVLLLSTLGDGFHPSMYCCTAQHFLIPVNKTPDWPAADCFRIDILPDWPNGTRCHALGIPFRTLPVHYGQWKRPGMAQEGPVVMYRVDPLHAAEIVSHCNALEEATTSWSSHQKQMYSATYRTHDQLRHKVLQLESAHSPADLDELTYLYNQHMRTVAIAQQKRWVDVDIPLHVIPVESRVFFSRQQLLANTKPFLSEYPARTDPGEQTKQMLQIEDAIRTLSIAPKGANQSDSDVLAEVLRAIVTVASKPAAPKPEPGAPKHELVVPTSFLHPSFRDADLELLAAVIDRDQKLAQELREVRLGYFSRACAVLNFVCQTTVSN